MIRDKLNNFLSKYSDDSHIFELKNVTDVMKVIIVFRRKRRFFFFKKKEKVGEFRFQLPKNTVNNIAKEYMAYCRETFTLNASGDQINDLMHCAVAMSEELGELLGCIKKYVYHDKKDLKEDVLMESGDFMWYFVNLLSMFGYNIETVMEANIIKLESRYPNGRTDLKYSRDHIGEKIIIKNQFGQN